jgi:amidase
MNVSEYELYDGLGLSALLYAKEVSPVELLRCAIELAECRGESCNAIIYPKYEAALNSAENRELEGAFGALPFLLKDSGLASKFLPSSMGSRMFANTNSSIDSTLNVKFQAAGLHAFARTTVPEFNMAPTTEAIQNGGPTRNPWDLTRSSGGSSGGAAVSVASRIVPIAHGSDGGGSVRIPASCCGVFGLKPSRGLIPFGPLRGEGWGGLATDGVLTRSVRDTAATLDAVAGMELGAPYAAPSQPGVYLASILKQFDRPQRVAMWVTAWDEIPVASECQDAVRQAGKLLQDLGHEVVEHPLPKLNYSSFIEAMTDVMASNVTVTVNGLLRHEPKHNPKDELEPAIYNAFNIGKHLTAEKYILALNRFHSISRLMANYMLEFDYVLTPTLTQLPLPLGSLSMNDDFRSFRKKAGLYTAFLAIVNASGQPAASIPLYWTKTGIPVGVQLIGRFGADGDILKLSSQLELAKPWQRLQPPHRDKGH